jgi:protein-tyrosine phosphatase
VYALSEDVYDEMLGIIGVHENSGKLQLFLNELIPDSNASVPDPWYGDEAGYKPVYEMIAKTCKAIAEKYNS